MKRLAMIAALLASPLPAQTVQTQVAPDVWSALQFCSLDKLYHFTGKCPPPPPPAWVPSPSIAGLPAIPSPFDYRLSLQPSWGNGAIPVTAAPDVVGAFRFLCYDAGTNNDDPIVFPNQPGRSHGHQYYCHGADASTTYASLRSGAGPFNGKAIKCVNCSSYWMPQMLDAAGNVVKPAFVSIYYKRRPASDPKCSLASGDPRAEGNCLTIPNGLRFVFGYDMLTGKTPTGELYFNCQGPTAKPGTYPNLTVALSNCPAGNKVGAVAKAPGCWDGKNLDSPNHRDHMAYPGYGTWGYLKCDSAHPYRIPDFTLGAWYPVAAGMHLSSDAMVPNAAPGTTFHADYFEAWDPTVKAMWTDNCINKMLNCSGGDLGNGLQLKGVQ